MWPFKKSRDALDEVLANADHVFVRARLSETFAGTSMTSELVRLLDAFAKDPSSRTARPLVECEPKLVSVFAGSRESRRFAEANGMPTVEPQRSARMLQQENGFRELAAALVDNRDLYDKLVTLFVNAGYSRSTINKAIAQHYEDIA